MAPADTTIRIVASHEGRKTDLDTPQAVSDWFAQTHLDAAYSIHFDGGTYAMPACARSSSDLIRCALASLPGYAPQNIVTGYQWTVYDDFTHAHCGTLALTLAALLNAPVVSVCRINPQACGDEDQSNFDPNLPPPRTSLEDLVGGFVHAGVLLADGTVLCPTGRTECGLWAYNFAQVETDFTLTVTDPEMLRDFVIQPTPEILRIVHAVAKLVAILSDKRFA